MVDVTQTSPPANPERRQADRKPLNTRVKITLPGKPEMEVRSFDIAMAGIGLVSEFNSRSSTPCYLAFSLPLSNRNYHRVQVSGVVAYSTYSSQRKGFATGIQFESVSAELSAALSAYMRK